MGVRGSGQGPTWHGLSSCGIQAQGAVAASTHGGTEDGGGGNNRCTDCSCMRKKIKDGSGGCGEVFRRIQAPSALSEP